MKIGGMQVADLVKEFKTPLYVYDEGHIERIVKEYQDNFKSNNYQTEIIYATKALDCLYMYNLASRLGLSLDVVSMGELYGAKKVGFDMKKVFFHGNNKSEEEILAAASFGVKTIVIDNVEEIKLINKVMASHDYVFECFIRINVGVSAHTHQYVITSHPDSKFGIYLESNDLKDALDLIKESKNLSFKGFQSHIGSQIFDMEGFCVAIEKLFMLMKEFDMEFECLDLGGGFGIKYTNEDKPIPFKDVCKILIETTNKMIKETGINIKKLLIEPGRSIVGEAGYTLYTIGQTKKTVNKMYYFIDGGMNDNIRPALYQAKYACDIAYKLDEKKTIKASIAGKCCESGDVIIDEVMLPVAKTGDILIVYSTGAYGYSMASNYNKMLKPAMVFVNNGQAKIACKRMSYDDLYLNEEFL